MGDGPGRIAQACPADQTYDRTEVRWQDILEQEGCIPAFGISEDPAAILDEYTRADYQNGTPVPVCRDDYFETLSQSPEAIEALTPKQRDTLQKILKAAYGYTTEDGLTRLGQWMPEDHGGESLCRTAFFRDGGPSFLVVLEEGEETFMSHGQRFTPQINSLRLGGQFMTPMTDEEAAELIEALTTDSAVSTLDLSGRVSCTECHGVLGIEEQDEQWGFLPQDSNLGAFCLGCHGLHSNFSPAVQQMIERMTRKEIKATGEHPRPALEELRQHDCGSCHETVEEAAEFELPGQSPAADTMPMQDTIAGCAECHGDSE